MSNITFQDAWRSAMRVMMDVIENPDAEREERMEAAQAILDFTVEMTGPTIPFHILKTEQLTTFEEEF